MIRIRRIKISWRHCSSNRLRGYKLYWSENERLDYNSPCVYLGNVTEVILPDALDRYPIQVSALRFGLTAVDRNDNESDMRIIGSFRLFDAIEDRSADTDDSPEACFPDPAVRLLLVQLNATARQAHCYEKARGLALLGATRNDVDRRTIREAKAALMQLDRQLDRMLSHDQSG